VWIALLNTIIDIIRFLNNGSVLPNQSDEITKVKLHNDDIELYVDYFSFKNKYYYFSQISEQYSDVVSIENDILSNEVITVMNKPEPESSYLLLFLKLNEINESTYSYVMNMEQYTSLFKRYVFYYTEEELNCFIKWCCEDLKKDGISNLTEILERLRDVNKNSNEVRFLTRLLIKVPFFNPVFPKATISDFDKIVREKLNSAKRKKEIKDINDIFNKLIYSDVESISNLVYEGFMGGGLNGIYIQDNIDSEF